eukprot:92235-Rhodomonas_salina.1
MCIRDRFFSDAFVFRHNNFSHCSRGKLCCPTSGRWLQSCKDWASTARQAAHFWQKRCLHRRPASAELRSRRQTSNCAGLLESEIPASSWRVLRSVFSETVTVTRPVASPVSGLIYLLTRHDVRASADLAYAKADPFPDATRSEDTDESDDEDEDEDEDEGEEEESSFEDDDEEESGEEAGGEDGEEDEDPEGPAGLDRVAGTAKAGTSHKT